MMNYESTTPAALAQLGFKHRAEASQTKGEVIYDTYSYRSVEVTINHTDKTINVEVSDVTNHYIHSVESLKQLLELLYGPQPTITDRVKTFEDACLVLGISHEEFKLTYPESISHHVKAILAHAKLLIISEALNEGWVPDWSNSDEYKYYPWFNMGSPSGAGFSYDVYDFWCTHSHVGSRLCYKTKQLAKYAGTQFEELYKEYFLIIKNK